MNGRWVNEDVARLHAVQNAGLSEAELASPDVLTNHNHAPAAEDGKGPYQCVPNSHTCKGYCDPTRDVGQLSNQCGIGKLCQGGTCQPALDGQGRRGAGQRIVAAFDKGVVGHRSLRHGYGRPVSGRNLPEGVG